MLAIIKKYKVLLIISSVIAVGAIVFALFPVGNVPVDGILVTNTGADPDNRIREELLVLLSELRTLNLDDTIFSDARFLSLVDYSVELKAQPVGRRNPFLPIGSDRSEITTDAVSATSTATTTLPR